MRADPWEWNTGNNQFMWTIYPMRGQDLVLDGIQVIPDKVHVGNNQIISVDIKNEGIANGSGNLSVYLDEVLVSTEEIEIAQGDSTTITIPWTPTRGSHTIQAIIDVPIHDPDKNNEHEITIKTMISDAIVSLTTISLSPADPEPGETVTVGVLVSNSGGIATNVTVSMFDYEDLAGSRTIHLRSGETITIAFIWTPTQKIHVLRAQITVVEAGTIILDGEVYRTIELEKKDEGDDDEDGFIPVPSIILPFFIAILAVQMNKNRIGIAVGKIECEIEDVRSNGGMNFP